MIWICAVRTGARERVLISEVCGRKPHSEEVDMTFNMDSHEEGIASALDRFLSDVQALGEDFEAVAAVASDQSNVYTTGLVDSPEAFLRLAASLVRAASTSYGWDEEEVALAGAFIIQTVVEAIREERPDPNLPLS